MGLREQIKAASVRKPLKVHVKEWNVDVYVRVMSVGERDDWELAWIDIRSKGVEKFKNFRAFYLVRTLCDEHGVRIWQDNEIDEVAALDLATDSADPRDVELAFLRRAIEAHRDGIAADVADPGLLDEALWAALDGKWRFPSMAASPSAAA